MRYNPQAIEAKWRKRWLAARTYEPDFKRAKKPYYLLMMFPYPSAEGLHIGGVRTFTGIDVFGRFMRMRGYDVFEPIGLDGFGIHSENFALKTGRHPMKLAEVTEKNFYRQLGAIGNGFAWEERLETYDPGYYKWTQWIFVEMFRKGLAYRKKSAVNWCPSCKTVLADEQVIAGECERCGTKVEKKDLEQWFFRITDYAERLLNNLEKIDWAEKVKNAQRNWIGRSEGAEIDFDIPDNANYVLIHGYKGSPQRNFFPWLKAELERRGHRVTAVSLPNPANPDVMEQVQHVIAHASFDENTVLLGHSLGTMVALKVAEQLKQPIAKLILAAGFISPRSNEHREFAKKFDWKFDFAKIRANARDITVLRDTGDSVVVPDRVWGLHRAVGGRLVDFKAEGEHICGEIEPMVLEACLERIKVFTTRSDTLFGATYLVLGPEHPFMQNAKRKIQNWKEVEAYLEKAKAKTDDERIAEGKEKTGVELKGVTAVNPTTNELIPVWVADYVLGNVGTGAIMAVPAHDQRDLDFAKKFKLPVLTVVEPVTGEPRGGEEFRKSIVAFVEDPATGEVLTLDWGAKAGGTLLVGGGIEGSEDPIEAARREIAEETGYTNLKFIATSERMHHHYVAVSKGNIARRIEAVGLHFQLIDRKQMKPAPDKTEHGTFNARWLKKTEAGRAITDPLHRYVFKKFAEGLAYTGPGLLTHSGEFDGMPSEQAKAAIAAFARGRRVVQYRLRDWLLSRQRYWGPPIPMIFCDACAKKKKGERPDMPGWYAVAVKDLPVKLPFLKDFRPTGTAASPLAASKSFARVRCLGCKAWARRETDVTDTFLDSAWYYLRYPSTRATRAKQAPWDPAITKQWLPVNMYIGGVEHSVLHLLYARFLGMVFHDWGLVPFEEPFTRFRAHGLVTKDGTKMSKSKGNVVNPDDYLTAYGSDALRMHLAFLAPLEQGGSFNDTGVRGITRFLERVWKFYDGAKFAAKTDGALARAVHQTIAKVTKDTEALQYNTAISALMMLLNAFAERRVSVSRSDALVFLQLIAPFAPHLAEELWAGLKQKGSIHRSEWPEADVERLVSATATVVVQVNGKVRDRIEIPLGLGEAEIRSRVLGLEKVKAQLGGREPKKFIYVPGRIASIVI